MNNLHRVNVVNWLKNNVNDRNTALGAFVSALFCPICFPALAGIASALGLSFLTRFEGIFLLLFHVFAFISLYSVWQGFGKHRVKLPLVLSGLGMLLIFGAIYQLLPIYALVYLGMLLLVGGAFLNAHHVRKYSALQCDC